MIERTLVWRDNAKSKCLGMLGDDTTLSGFSVGDVVAYNNLFIDNNLIAGIVCKDSDGFEYVMGLKGNTLRSLSSKTQVIKIISHENLTDDILREVNEAVQLKEVEVKFMTQEEIEEALGHKVRIVK